MFKLCQIGVTVIVKRCWVDGCGGGFGSAGVCGGGNGGGGGCGGDQCVVLVMLLFIHVSTVPNIQA